MDGSIIREKMKELLKRTLVFGYLEWAVWKNTVAVQEDVARMWFRRTQPGWSQLGGLNSRKPLCYGHEKLVVFGRSSQHPHKHSILRKTFLIVQQNCIPEAKLEGMRGLLFLQCLSNM